ncbi:MAG TPA: Mov34/MPN/PAD-1 family protein [Chloroflexia bacterium]|nr:Mov34/MPN/PAD-1 family protein [Chloroflexia bacterium]
MNNQNSVVTKAITYKLLTGSLPGKASALLEYILAANGLFVRGQREGLEVLFPLAECEVRGALAKACPFLRLAYPPVEQELVERMLALARQARHPGSAAPVEILFYLAWERAAGRWRLLIPSQVQEVYSVQPVPDLPLECEEGFTYGQVLIEIHSHHHLPAYFSSTDDRDEATGFRLYGVLGNIFEKPQIRFRVGLHGYFWPVRAEAVCRLPAGMVDLNAESDLNI